MISPAVSRGVGQLARPFSVALQRGLELGRRHRMLGVEELVTETANRLFSGEAIELFCASIPVDDGSWKLPDQDRVVRLFQQVRLLPQRLFGLLAGGDVVVGLEDGKRSALRIRLQRPSARHDDLRSVAPRVDAAPLPSGRSGSALRVISSNGAGKTVRSSS